MACNPILSIAENGWDISTLIIIMNIVIKFIYNLHIHERASIYTHSAMLNHVANFKLWKLGLRACVCICFDAYVCVIVCMLVSNCVGVSSLRPNG